MSVKAGSIVVSGSLALALTVAPALADGPGMGQSWYAGLFAGAAWPSDFNTGFGESFSSNTGFAFGGVVGTNVSNSVRVELEVSDIMASADCAGKCVATSVDVDALSILGNAWLDIPIDSSITPYIGGGIGGTQVSVDGGGNNGSAWSFAYQLGAGLRMNVGTNVMVDLGYRYKSATNIDAGDIDPGFGDADIDANAHVVQLGLTFTL